MKTATTACRVSEFCNGKKCRFCGVDATHKVEESVSTAAIDNHGLSLRFTYLCCVHFTQLMVESDCGIEVIKVRDLNLDVRTKKGFYRAYAEIRNLPMYPFNDEFDNVSVVEVCSYVTAQNLFSARNFGYRSFKKLNSALVPHGMRIEGTDELMKSTLIKRLERMAVRSQTRKR